jgi:hypothetical protein
VEIDVKILRTYSLSKFQAAAAVAVAAAATATTAAAKTTITTAYVRVHHFCSINQLKVACLTKTQGNHSQFLNKFVN